MTEIATIVSSLNALTAAMQEATHKFIATVEKNPAAFASVEATAVDLKALADHTVRHTDLVREVAGRINIRELAEEYTYGDIAGEISLSDLAGEIELSELAGEFSARDIADEIDLNDLRDKCVEAMSSDIDTEQMQENIAREVAENVDAASVAQELDMGDVVRELVDEIDMDELAERMVSAMQGEHHDDIADGVAAAIMGDQRHRAALVAELAKYPSFICAVACEMGAAMLRGSKAQQATEQEPHGARETFVPAKDGEEPEIYNPLQD